MLGECILSESDRRTLEELAPLRLRPGRPFDARAFSEADRQAIAAGIADADAEIRERGPSAGPTELLHRAWIARTALGAPLEGGLLGAGVGGTDVGGVGVGEVDGGGAWGMYTPASMVWSTLFRRTWKRPG